MNVNLGTSGYKPPEVGRSKPYDGYKVDIFCLGVSLIRLVIGTSAFGKATRNDQKYHMIMQKKYKEYWEMIESQNNGIKLSEEFKDLYIKMILYNPQLRLTAKEVLEHPWFKEINEMDQILKENLENKIKEEFIKLIPLVKENSLKEMKAADKMSETSLYNVRSYRDEGENYFNPEMRVKYTNTPIKMDNCIKIKGYINPNKFLNLLVYKINKKFDMDDCLIQTSLDKPKFNLTFENNNEESDDEEDNEKENEDEDEDDDEQGDEVIIQIKLYETSDGHLLRFIKKRGNRKDFLDKFLILSKLVEEIIS